MENILGVFGINWKLLLVQMVNFGLLLGVLWYFLYRPVVAMIERRRQMMEKGVKDAEEAANRLAESATQRETMIAAATREAEKIVGNAERRGLEKEENIVREAHQKGESVMREAEVRAQDEKRRIMSETREEIARLAVLGMERLLRDKK